MGMVVVVKRYEPKHRDVCLQMDRGMLVLLYGPATTSVIIVKDDDNDNLYHDNGPIHFKYGTRRRTRDVD